MNLAEEMRALTNLNQSKINGKVIEICDRIRYAANIGKNYLTVSLLADAHYREDITAALINEGFEVDYADSPFDGFTVKW